MKFFNLSIATVMLLSGLNALANEKIKPKRTLKNNMMEVYNVLPENAISFGDAFKKAEFYGRIRTNMFKWDWDKEIDGKQLDNKAHGVGASLVYKTAPFKGVSATLGLYHSSSPFDGLNQNKDEAGFVKAGKDTFSRYSVNTDGKFGMTVLAQAYIQYNIAKTELKIGRQIFESFLTKSNDTKMIPHTLEGISLVNKDLDKTKLYLAYFDKQKLRDHTTFHDVITFKDASGHKWNNNDDSAVHKGLTYDNFVNAGEDPNHELIIAGFTNKSINGLKFDMIYGAVPDVVSSLTLEGNYKIKLGNGYALIPGIRYMSQFDDGGGVIGGASLKGKITADDARGYTNPHSLDSSLIAGRLVLKNSNSKFQVGYSKIDDEADIIAPWRGFVTGGYTRAMAQYNWYANTETWDIEAFYNFGKAGIIPDFRAMIRYAMQDFDDSKPDVQADSNIVHIDMWKQFKAIPNFEAKLRIGLVDADPKEKTDVSYNEYRLELNYLF